MPVLDTPAMDRMADAFSLPQDSSVRDSELQTAAPEQPERRYPLRERKPPQRFYYQYITLYFYQVQFFFPLLQEGESYPMNPYALRTCALGFSCHVLTHLKLNGVEFSVF